jgi:hypothetical protein
MLRSTDPRRILMALLFAPSAFAGCDQVHSFVLGELDEAVVDEGDWGPFKLGMSMKEIIAIIKAKTGKDPQIDHLPGLKWQTIFFEDKMLTIQDGTLLCVHRSEHEGSLRLGGDDAGAIAQPGGADQDAAEVEDN